MKYRIPVTWMMWGEHVIEADSLLEALAQVEFRNLGLPYNGQYVDESYEIDEESIAITYGPAVE